MIIESKSCMYWNVRNLRANCPSVFMIFHYHLYYIYIHQRCSSFSLGLGLRLFIVLHLISLCPQATIRELIYDSIEEVFLFHMVHVSSYMLTGYVFQSIVQPDMTASHSADSCLHPCFLHVYIRNHQNTRYSFHCSYVMYGCWVQLLMSSENYTLCFDGSWYSWFHLIGIRLIEISGNGWLWSFSTHIRQWFIMITVKTVIIMNHCLIWVLRLHSQPISWNSN